MFKPRTLKSTRLFVCAGRTDTDPDINQSQSDEWALCAFQTKPAEIRLFYALPLIAATNEGVPSNESTKL